MSNFLVYVQTGDRLSAGTGAKVKLVLHDDNGNVSSPIVLDSFFRNDFQPGEIDKFFVPSSKVRSLPRSAKIVRIEVWRNNFGISSDWFVDKIVVENEAINQHFVFPLLQWIKAKFHYNIALHDTFLPMQDEFPKQRRKELQDQRQEYILDQKIPNGPVQAQFLPKDEKFSFAYQWDLAKLTGQIVVRSGFVLLTRHSFESIDDMKTNFTQTILTKPSTINNWDDDKHFASMSLVGVNHSMLSLATEIPAKFPVTDSMLQPYLEGLTIAEALQQKRLFISDYYLLDGIPTVRDLKVCAPIGLFFTDNAGILKPVAIQLNQKPGTDNPIFTPRENNYTWTLVKMWYNNADSAHHESLTHLGLTHLLMEGIALISHRELSNSHPIFKLLAPHFLYVIAIDAQAVTTLVSPGGWVDEAMNCGIDGMFEIIRRGYAEWRMDVQGTLPEDLKKRGVDDPKILGNYYYRDDALLLYDSIKKYVTNYVKLYYTSTKLLLEDYELQRWAMVMVKERNRSEGGLGLKGVPGNGHIDTTDILIQILTSIIYTCSVAHAATNFPQYDQYAFSPNYPARLKGVPPTDPEANTTEADLVAALNDRKDMLKTMAMVKTLSSRGTKPLGDFEVQYVYDPKAVEVVNEFRKDLLNVSKVITDRNETRKEPYIYLDPLLVPNAISI